MKKFEYKIRIHATQINSDDFYETLNNLGKQGWELCSYYDGTSIWKKEISDNIDYAELLIGCSLMRNVSNLQHRTISEFNQFVEDVMSNKPEFEKYRTFDINSKDAIEKWIIKFHEYCKEEYKQIENRMNMEE